MAAGSALLSKHSCHARLMPGDRGGCGAFDSGIQALALDSPLSCAVQEREKRLAAAEAEAALHKDLQNYARELSEAKLALARLSEDTKDELSAATAAGQRQLQVRCLLRLLDLRACSLELTCCRTGLLGLCCAFGCNGEWNARAACCHCSRAGAAAGAPAPCASAGWVLAPLLALESCATAAGGGLAVLWAGTAWLKTGRDHVCTGLAVPPSACWAAGLLGLAAPSADTGPPCARRRCWRRARRRSSRQRPRP